MSSSSFSSLSSASSASSASEDKKKLKVIRKCFVELCKSMNPEDMKLELFAKGLLTSNEMDRLGLPIMTPGEKSTFILMKLESKGTGAFDYFMDALQATSEQNPAHTELVELLLRELNNNT